MEEKEYVGTRGTGVKWGVIYGIVSAIIFAGTDMAGLTGNQAVTWIGVLIIAVFLYFAHNEYKTIGDGFMNYGQGIGIAAWIGLIAGLISAVFTFIYTSFINTNYFEVIKQKQIEGFEKQGLSDAEIEQAIKVSESFTNPAVVSIMAVFMSVLFTVLIALIISIITKKTRPEFE